MTDYEELNLIGSSSPHVRSNDNTQKLMLRVIVALLPALAMAVYYFGLRALTGTLVSVVGSVFFEWLYRKLLHKPDSIGDLSAAVTGLLLAMTCPSALPYWMLLIGDFFAIVVVKQLYGGIGKNFINPALVGRAVLVACYASAMTVWAKPFEKVPLFRIPADVVTAATPMTILKNNGLAALQETYSLRDVFMGFVGGSAGEISALMLLLGGLYLIARRVISWHIPVTFIGTVAVLTVLFPQGGAAPLPFMLYELCGGGLMLNAFFMATDYVTSPVTKQGQVIYGIGCGLITVLIRYFGAYAEGACYAILVMNCLTWLIDRSIKPERFGVVRSRKSRKKVPEA